jgi:hypothetical protein
MIQESLFKSNFLGRDGFRWWIGQIPPESAHGTQINGGGWGNRFKVRIMGYHPYNIVELPDNDLPWAQCLLPTTSGTGAGNNATSVKISPGDVVFGFFLDTDNAQTPIIMGCFGRTSQVLTSESAGPFRPFTGYTNKIEKPNGTLKPDQSHEQNAKSQKSPRNVSPEQAKNIGPDEISYFSAIGDKIQLANTVNNTLVGKISTEVENLINKVKVPKIFTDIKNEINRVTDKIQAISNGLVGNMMNGLYGKLSTLLNSGLKLLYQKVYDVVFLATNRPGKAHLAGVAAQTAMVGPVQILQKAIPCVAGKIVSSLGSIIKDIIISAVDNIENFVSCVADQFVGSLINDIIGKISSGLESAIGGVSKILQFFSTFSVDNFLRGSIDSIKGIVGMFDCNQSKGKSDGIVDQWIIGSGPNNAPIASFDKILENANISNAIATANDILGGAQDIIGAFNSINNLPNQIGNCYTGKPLSCSAPTISIFGGGGSGATSIPLLGAIVGTTGSIIGAKITNGGSGYRFPPFVQIMDNCRQGYGAIARSTINDSGEVSSVYIVSEGENYPIEFIENYIVSDIIIQNPGQNYNVTDTATDQFGNSYSIEVFEGSITKASPINTTTTTSGTVITGIGTITTTTTTTNTTGTTGTTANTNSIQVNDLPIITIKSDTGSGAILRPILDTMPVEYQGEVKQVIDCVT